jgi:ABC-2 type transport system permease protein
LLRTAAILGLTAGASESVARAIGYLALAAGNQKPSDERRPGSQWHDGVMIGLGHGGIEAMGLASVLLAASVSSLLSLRGMDLSTLNVAPAQLAIVESQMSQITASPWVLLLPLLERGIAITLHVVLSLLVWSAVARRNPVYLLIAILYHALVDASGVYASRSLDSSLLLELLLAAMLIPGLVWMWRTRPEGPPDGRRYVRGVNAQWSLLASAVRKELQQQWRTKRVLVVAAVFLLFGMGSPLLARFTPELLSSIEGAEQFAGLIPRPTNVDALSQYIKNLTQFGFIMAVLLGMASVAGEKERGTVAMILSKPMPRWAFLLSKFVAQAFVYAAGFVLAGLGAYYYTSILFDPLVLGPFMFGNLLLLIWLLVFAALTLLASTIASTTGAAAGLALLGSVLLLLTGSVPKIGIFAPSGLVAWASQLGLAEVATGAGGFGNGGALAANIALIIVCLITSVAVFETQEL